MSAIDCERKMVDCPYCGKAFNVPTVEQQLAAAEQREAAAYQASVVCGVAASVVVLICSAIVRILN